MIIGAGLAGLAVLYLVTKQGAAAAAGEAVGGAVVDAAVGATTGVALGIGDAIGLPRTNQTECEKAMAEGRYWDASFVCPATDFIGGTASGVKTTLSDLWDKL
jgi:hypothetical protein